MRLVADTNILFTYFWEGSALRKICDERRAELFTPELALKELDKYADSIARRTGRTADDFRKMRKEMLLNFTVIDKKDYSGFYTKTRSMLAHLPKNELKEASEDLDFLAASIMLCCPLWTNDKLLRKQSGVIILDSKEVVSLLDVE
jgi:predicted nucleic acid-binding protein